VCPMSSFPVPSVPSVPSPSPSLASLARPRCSSVVPRARQSCPPTSVVPSFAPIRAGGARQRLSRALRRRRRSLAVGLAMTAAALAAAAPQGAPDQRGGSEPVLVAARDLPAGARLSSHDLVTARLPADRVPAGAMRHARGARGHTLAGPVRRGEPLTDRRLLGPALLAGFAGPGGRDLVAAPVRIADAAAARLLRPGDRIDVLAGPGESGGWAGEGTRERAARVVAPGVRVLTVPRAESEKERGDGALIVLAVPRPVAAALAGAAATSRLTVTMP
jgi:pilus assembly protein CpaB